MIENAKHLSTYDLWFLTYSRIDETKLNNMLKRHCSNFEIRNTTLDESGIGERTIEVKDKDTSSLLRDLKSIKGVKKLCYL